MNVARSTVLAAIKNSSPSNILLRNYAFKSDLKIKWVRPEKIPCYKPEKTGDLEGLPAIDKTQLQLDFRNSKELIDSSAIVKKLFTLEFAPKNRTNRLYFHEVTEKVKRHDFDVASVEVKIAKWTAIVRALQEVLDRFPRDKRLKVKLKELIDKRKKQLKYLRRWDYKRFEWLLEALNIVYKPPPNEFRWVARKESLVKLTNKYCENLKNEKLEAYKQLLETEQPVFLQEKIHSLQFIRDEQKDCGVEVTVTQEEIDSVKQLLKDMLEERKLRESAE